MNSIAELQMRNQALENITNDQAQRMTAMAELLDEIPHYPGCAEYPSQKARCLACAWEKLKEDV